MRSLGQRALNPLTLASEAEMILRGCDTIVRPESARSGAGIALAQVVPAEALTSEAVAQHTETERFQRQVPERYEHREGAAPKRPIGARRPLLRAASVAVEHPLPLERESLEHELVAQGKRW